MRDIYLDKSFRNLDGESSGEMNRLINELLKTNQTVDLDTLQALHTPDNTNSYESIDYNRLSENNSFSNDSEFEKLYNKMLSENIADPATVDKVQLAGSPPQQSTTRGSTENELIDLQYEDVTKPNVYDHVIKKHKEKSLLDATNSWGIFDIFK